MRGFVLFISLGWVLVDLSSGMNVQPAHFFWNASQAESDKPQTFEGLNQSTNHGGFYEVSNEQSRRFGSITGKPGGNNFSITSSQQKSGKDRHEKQ